MDPENLVEDRTWLATVLFMDIAGYSTRSVQVQARLKGRFTSYLSRAIRDVAENDRILLDTGDGAAICFLGAPEIAMFTGLKLRGSFVQDGLENEVGLKVRMGINLGPLKLVRDINGNLNAIGDGINTCQRVMSFAGENEVLVSRSFFEVVSCLSEDYHQLFRYEGVKRDKHVREHPVYQLVSPGQQVSTKSSAPALQLAGPVSFDPGMLAALSALLGPAAGPIAGHLVRQASERVHDAEGLVRELASEIPDPETRAKFSAQARRIAGSITDPDTSQVWDNHWLENVRKELAAHVGPVARILVETMSKRTHNRRELCNALSAELPAGQRERFLRALGVE